MRLRGGWHLQCGDSTLISVDDSWTMWCCGDTEQETTGSLISYNLVSDGGETCDAAC